MAADKELAAFLVADDMNASLGRNCQHAQLRHIGNGFRVGLRVAGMGRIIFLVKTAEQSGFGV